MQNKNDIALQHQAANRDWIAQVWKSIGSGGKLAIAAAAVICFSVAASNVSEGSALFTATASCIAIPTIFYLPAGFYRDLCGVNTCRRAMELLESAYRDWQPSEPELVPDLPDTEPWTPPADPPSITEPAEARDLSPVGPDLISDEFLKDEATLFREKIDQLYADLANYLEEGDQKNANKTLYLLATLLYKKERVEEAISHCRSILESKVQTRSIRIKAARLLVQIYSKAGNGEAVKFYSSMIHEVQHQKVDKEKIFRPRTLEEKPRLSSESLELAPLPSEEEDDSHLYAIEFGAQDHEYIDELSIQLVDQYKEAERALQSGDYNKTIEICRNILNYKEVPGALYDRDYQLAESMLIGALMKSGQTEEARPYLFNLSPKTSNGPSRFSAR